jgi:hypothetical protein
VRAQQTKPKKPKKKDKKQDKKKNLFIDKN